MRGASKEAHTTKGVMAAGHVVGVEHVHMRPSLEAQTGHADCSREGIYGLSSSFEVTKSSLPNSLPSTCKVLCLGFWKQGDLVLRTYRRKFLLNCF
jgi:hypothetical protein